MASLNAIYLEKKREEYLKTARPIKELLVDDTGDESYGDVPSGAYPESVSTMAQPMPPENFDDSAPSMRSSSFMGMRPTDIRAMQAAQMSQAEKDFYFVQGDVNVVSGNGDEYNTEYEDNYGAEDIDDYDDYEDEDDYDEYDDEEFIDDADDEVVLEVDFDGLLDEDDFVDDGLTVIDDDGDIDEEDGFDDDDLYMDEEDEDIEEIVSLLKSMGINDFGDDFDDGYETKVVPANPHSRPTDSDSTAAIRKPKRGGETGGQGQVSGKSANKVYGLLFK